MSEVEIAISVEIADGDGVRGGPGAEIGLRPESTHSIAKEDGDVVVGLVRDGEIEVAIPVEITYGDGVRGDAGSEVDRCIEGNLRLCL